MIKKKILITGSNGFIGSYLKEYLRNDYDIMTFDASDGDVVSHLFLANNIQHVFHLAAKTSVAESWEQPYPYYMVNIMGTVNMLEYCRKCNIPITLVSTYPYGMPKYNPIDEAHPCAPNSIYNHSKYLAEDICRFYADNYNVSVTILRLFNVYGGGQNESFLIPHIIKQALFASQIEVKDLTPKRDYVYITDVIRAMSLTVGLNGFHIYNIGSGESQSVEEVCNIVVSITGSKKNIISSGIKRKNEVTDMVADISKIKNDLHWKPEIDFYDGIANTIKFYLEKGDLI